MATGLFYPFVISVNCFRFIHIVQNYSICKHSFILPSTRLTGGTIYLLLFCPSSLPPLSFRQFINRAQCIVTELVISEKIDMLFRCGNTDDFTALFHVRMQAVYAFPILYETLFQIELTEQILQ